MSRIIRVAVMAGLAVTVLISCASVEKQWSGEARDRKLFQRYAGPPVESFGFLLNRYQATQHLGNGQFVLWTDVNEVHLITVQQPCPWLDFSNHLMPIATNQVVTRGIAYVSKYDERCYITEIRPVDYLRMKQDLHRQS